MLRVGLTGNIGSGKSVVAEIFSTLGVPVYDADGNAKKFLEDNHVKNIIIETFGEKILIPGTSNIDKKALANIVFNDIQKLAKLNSIIHPFVIQDFKNWCESFLTTNNEQRTTNYVIIEAAILFESGYNSICDKIITVTCPEDIRISRIMKRDNISEAEVKLRINNQWNEKDKTVRSDFIVVNDESCYITPQILNIHKQLLAINIK